MTPNAVHIDRLLLRGTPMDPRHAERLRVLVARELASLLEGGAGAGAPGRVPADASPERLAAPLAREIGVRLPAEVRP